MKRVDLVAPPMAGHLHPMLGIAKRLTEEPGLDVRLISTAAAQPATWASGVTGRALLEGADDIIETVVNPPYRIGSDPRKLFRQFRAAVRLQQDFQAELLELWRAEPPDLVLADFTMGAVGPAADAVGAPWWTTHPSPCAIEGRAGPPAYLGGWRPGVRLTGRARDAVGRRWVRGFKRVAPRMAGVRLSSVGLGKVYRPDGSEAIYSADRTFALTPASIEYERALPPAVRYVGPVLFTPPSDAPAPELSPGHRHVLVTAGTHLPWHKQALLDAAGAAASDLPADVVVHVSLGRCADEVRVPPGVVVHDYVSYEWDLPRFDAVVHHGGAGVLGHTLAAGLPAVVWPVDYDQFDHAVRLVDAGVAVRLFQPVGLANRIRQVLDDPRHRAAAQRVAAEIAAAPAVETIAAEVRARLLRPESPRHD